MIFPDLNNSFDSEQLHINSSNNITIGFSDPHRSLNQKASKSLNNSFLELPPHDQSTASKAGGES